MSSATRATTFLLYSEINRDSIADSLGRADYSYYFVLNGFRPALDRVGSTILVHQPADVDAIYDAEREAGRDCVFLCFTPPHKAPVHLRCPTVCVFAWEFGNIPDEALDEDPRSDWRTVFAHHGRAITLSEHAARTVRAAMGSDFPIDAIPVPIAERFAGLDGHGARTRVVAIRGAIYDSHAHGPFFERQVATPPPEPSPEPSPEPQSAAVTLAIPAAKSRLRTSIGVSRYYGLLWYRQAVRDLLLPRRAVRALSLAGRGYSRLRFVLRPMPTPPLPLPLPPPPRPTAPKPPPEPEQRVTLDGVVYTAVINPADGRKNWQDILTGFCWAFRDNPNATLVMKMVHHDRLAFEGSLAHLIRVLQPFRCRVVVLQGWLDDCDYDALVAATDYYVNASSCEGLCLPLMEFMSAGRPAIAPDHTAMADYVDRANAFALRSGIEYNVWPHDPRDLFRTTRYRLEWESLMEAYRISYTVATEDPARYAAMGKAAGRAMQRTCSLPVVEAKLRQALGPHK